MKKFVWVVGLIVVGGIISFFFIASKNNVSGSTKIASFKTDDPNAPKLEVSEQSFDFAKIKLTDKPTHDFIVKNIGKSPLVISDIMTSCHCTTAIFKSQGQPDSPAFSMAMNGWQGTVSPGSSAIIEAIYDPAVMPVNGPVSRTVTFSTNDPINSTVRFEISANVQ